MSQIMPFGSKRYTLSPSLLMPNAQLSSLPSVCTAAPLPFAYITTCPPAGMLTSPNTYSLGFLGLSLIVYPKRETGSLPVFSSSIMS